MVNVAVPDLGKEIARMEQKIESGAQFFQTNAVYDPDEFAGFMKAVEGFGVPVLAGIIMLKSARQARYMTERIPGVVVPDAMIEELDSAGEPRRNQRCHDGQAGPRGRPDVQGRPRHGHRLGAPHTGGHGRRRPLEGVKKAIRSS